MAAGDITSQLQTASDFKGAVFDGVDDNISLGSVYPLNSSSLANFSISANVYVIYGPDAGGGNTICQLGFNFAGNTGMIFRINQPDKAIAPSRISIYLGNTSYDFQTMAAIPERTWTNLILTQEGDQSKIYINGVLSETKTTKIIPAWGTTANSLGDENIAEFKGAIWDFRAYDRTLSGPECLSLASGSGSSDGLVRHFKLMDNYQDSGSLGLNASNNGTYLTNTLSNKITADMKSMNLAAATDKLIVLPVYGRDGVVKIIKAERAAA